MNETVAKIVELLFQNVEMTDEVRAIHDEVMNNCQERFGDLLSRGLTEDEAIEAVVESLKGMEEVLSTYPKKAPDPAPGRTQNAMLVGCAQASFSGEVTRVTVSLTSEDVTIEPSPDGEAHVLTEADGDSAGIAAELTNGELRVTRALGAEEPKKAIPNVRVNVKDMNFDSLGDLLGKVFQNIRVSVGSGADTVRIQVPERALLRRVDAQTTSGDVGIEGIAARELNAQSRSGDLRVEMPGRLESASLHTTSGDVEAWLSAERATLQALSGDTRFVGSAGSLEASSTGGDVTVELTAGPCARGKVHSVSGDVEVSGVFGQLTATTTSGDVGLRVTADQVNVSTVSGDMHVTLEGATREVTGRTTSGDVTVQLPAGTTAADVTVRTTSGDVRQGVAHVPGAVPKVELSTISGDVSIR